MKSTTRIQKGRSLTEDITGGGGGAGAVPVCITISDFCLTCNKTPTVAAAQHASSPRAPPASAPQAPGAAVLRVGHKTTTRNFTKIRYKTNKSRGGPPPPPRRSRTAAIHQPQKRQCIPNDTPSKGAEIGRIPAPSFFGTRIL